MSEPVVDQHQRQRALDPRASFIVQAPAGSGKTELLTQRILALLAHVERPEEVLSITFTRKAAAEMRARLLAALGSAAESTSPESEHARTTWQLAREVLKRDRRLNWQLLRNPNRLQLVTIDSFCAHLVRRMPWLSRFGAPPAISDDPRDSYRLAAERVLLQGLSGSVVRKPVRLLLRHLDNRLDLLRDMLVEMLKRRDQWLRHLLGQRHEQSRAVLEASLRDFVVDRLKQLDELLGERLKEELLDLAVYAGSNLNASAADSRLATLAQLDAFPKPEPEGLDSWLLLAELLLTQAGGARSRVTKSQGFPADKSEPAQAMKQRMQQLLEQLQDDPVLVAALDALRRLPHALYFDHQWRVLQGLIDLLPVAAAELDKVFREQGHIDFIAIASGARVALGESDSPEELLLQLDSRISHILVDEFQDTSFGQYELLERLVAGWQADDGRTLFLVGDPMQSIYRFREAEVGLFIRTMRHGLGQLQLEPLQLRVNFRSQAALIDWNNRLFAGIFPHQENEPLGAVTFAAASAFKPPLSASPAEMVLLDERDDQREASLLAERIAQTCAREPQSTHAVLVRSRAHAVEIAVALKNAGLRYQAQELEPLDARQAILDLLALTRALIHPGDRLAWLALLRAPWCGLRLESLLTLCEGDSRSPLWSLLCDPARMNWLAEEERERLMRFVEVMEGSLQRRGREPLARLVHATWLSLGGPACCSPGDCEDAGQYLRLLSEVEEGGDLFSLETLEHALSSLYAAPDPLAGPQVQIMTIHKSKGLEFDHVYLPGLGRSVRGQQKELLRWLEHPDYGLLLAPVPSHAGQSGDATYRAIGDLQAAKDDYETVRLLYVACTRARCTLTLYGHVRPNGDGPLPPANSLLEVAWPLLADEAGAPLAAGESDDAPSTLASPLLHRLPGGWRAPQLPAPLQFAGVGTRRASEEPASLEVGDPAGDVRRFIGTVVHRWLERMVRQGIDGWTPGQLEAQREKISRQLFNLGYPESGIEAAGDEVLRCLRSTLRGERGRWVLDAHDKGECELPLSGFVAGERIDAVVDRTFVDTEGARWVIDYKTSSPGSDESRHDFLQREKERYGSQLSMYLELFTALEPDRRIVAALYFPLLDELLVVAERSV